MKALTLHQPWASLIAVGAKTIETRSWSTKHRGPLAIHAAKTEAPSRTFAAQSVSTPALSREQWNEMPFGAVVAIAELVDVRFIGRSISPANRAATVLIESREQVDDPIVYAPVPEDQVPYGDFTPGRWAWILEDIRPLDPPRPAVGHQGLWRWEVVPS